MTGAVMARILEGLRVIEASAFVAAPGRDDAGRKWAPT